MSRRQTADGVGGLLIYTAAVWLLALPLALLALLLAPLLLAAVVLAALTALLVALAVALLAPFSLLTTGSLRLSRSFWQLAYSRLIDPALSRGEALCDRFDAWAMTASFGPFDRALERSETLLDRAAS